MPDVQSSVPSNASRRALLGAGLGAVAAFVANGLARPSAALADGESMQVGGIYTNAHTATALRNSANSNDVFRATSTGGGTAIRGETAFGDAAIEGHQSGSGTVVSGRLAGAGVAVFGQSNKSRAIQALGTDAADGIFTQSEHGTALLTEGLAPDATALRVDGRARFSRSGIATVGSGKSKVAVTIDPINSSTFALATLQQFRAGVYVAATELSVTNKALTVRLNTNVESATKVAYLVLEGA
jgi:hypothetical protein